MTSSEKISWRFLFQDNGNKIKFIKFLKYLTVHNYLAEITIYSMCPFWKLKIKV